MRNILLITTTVTSSPKDEFKNLSMTNLLPLFTKMLKRDPLDKRLFAMGGDRLNAQLGFVAMNTLFLREHNRLCGLLSSAYPQWDDERLFQTARIINIAILAKVVIEEYINHISPIWFRLSLKPGAFEKQKWYRTNWMTIEFNILYRWHALVPDYYCIEGVAKPVKLEDTLFNNGLLIDRGLGGFLEDASRQAAGEIGLFNTPTWLLPFEKATVELGRCARLPGYNEYRKHTGDPPARDFFEITRDNEIAGKLAEVYKRVDQVEFYTGLLAEPVRTNSALPNLAAVLVAADAFSQALTNPLLSRRLYNQQTFTRIGMDAIASTMSLSDILHRNLPPGSPHHHISMKRMEQEMRDCPQTGGATSARTDGH